MNSVVKKEKINKILNNDDYINWLEEFTLDNPKFYCDSWFSSSISSPIIKQNIQDISLLYEIIQNYAQENYINPILTVCGNYYQIKHNNIGYHLGIMTGPETIYYCMRSNEEENYIAFKDIQNNKKTQTSLFVNSKMKELTELINSMIDNDISSDIILDETEKTLQKVLKNKKNSKLDYLN